MPPSVTLPCASRGRRTSSIRVRAAGLNPVDYKTRDGVLRIIRNYPLPIAMGNELAGVVERVGAQVTRFRAGEHVFARVDKNWMGALAELCPVDEALVAHAPTAIDLATAAAVPLAGLTALQVLRDEIKVAPGMRLLVTGGAGGVGTFAVQLARHLGGHVTTHGIAARPGARARNLVRTRSSTTPCGRSRPWPPCGGACSTPRLTPWVVRRPPAPWRW